MYNEIESYSGQLTSAHTAHLRGLAQLKKIEDKARQRKGIQAQIESVGHLVALHQELSVMRATISDLLEQSLEQSKQLAERNKVDAQRFRENARLIKIAAWAGVISVFIMIAQWLFGK